MPVTFAVPNVLVLNKYGKFIAITPPGFTIPAANAVSVTAADTGGWQIPYNQNLALYIPVTVPIPEGWAAIVERFNWGCSDNDGRLFYEVWQEPGELAPYMIEEKFHCCGVITSANTDNRSTHPSAGTQIEFRIWNRSLTVAEFPAAVDAYVEISGWVYIFRIKDLDKILRFSKEVEYNMVDDDLNNILAAIMQLGESLGVAPSPPIGGRW